MNKLIMGLGILLVSTYANASCVQKNLAGTWAGGAIFSNSNYDTCTVSINSSGYLSGYCESGYVSGRLTVTSGCAVKGNIGKFSLTSATLSNTSKRHIAGFGSQNGYRASFAAAK